MNQSVYENCVGMINTNFTLVGYIIMNTLIKINIGMM